MSKARKISEQIDILSPPSEEVIICDRTTGQVHSYVQGELSLRRTSDLLQYLASLFSDSGDELGLNELVGMDVSDTAGVARFTGKLVSFGPVAMAKVVAIILGMPDDADWIADNLSPRELLPILRRFTEQNDVPGLMRDFSALVTDVRAAMKATESK